MLEALPPELREQVERTWSRREEEEEQPGASCAVTPPPPRDLDFSSSPPPDAHPPPGTLLLQIPNQPGQTGSTGIILALPDFSQVTGSNCLRVMNRNCTYIHTYIHIYTHTYVHTYIEYIFIWTY